MATTAKNAILKAMVDGVITELMVKTVGEQVFLDENTTLSSKITEMITAINARAKTTDVQTMINDLKSEILGDVPVAAYDTFTELAKYIESHEDARAALEAAIGNKADKTTITTIQNTLNGLGALANKSTVAESDLDSTLKTKINNASGSSHSHSNKAVLDTITSEKLDEWDNASDNTHSHSNKAVLDTITSEKLDEWDTAYKNNHSHSNKSVLDGVTTAKVNEWNAKAKVYVASSQPSSLTANDLWIQI